MPLKKGSSPKTISKNIKEMMHSRTFASRESDSKKHDMAIAAAERMARSRTNKKSEIGKKDND